MKRLRSHKRCFFRLGALFAFALFLAPALVPFYVHANDDCVVAQLGAALEPGRFQGYVTLPNGHEIYADYLAVDPKQPTVVLVNGLVYSTQRWDKLFGKLASNKKYNILRYDFLGQSKTLQRAAERDTLQFPAAGLTLSDHADDLHALIQHFAPGKKVNVVGLSYGASIAAEFAVQHPEQVQRLVFMAPLVVPLDQYQANGRMMNNMLAMTRLWWGQAAADAQWDTMYRSYVSGLNLRPDPGVTKAQEEEALFQLIRAAKNFDLRAYDFSGIPEVHLLVAERESADAMRDQVAAWENFPVSAKGLFVLIKQAEHAIPDSSPTGASIALEKIIRPDVKNPKKTVGSITLPADP
jgi:pimeloyl-ACP methyl ester carboxylesterase